MQKYSINPEGLIHSKTDNFANYINRKKSNFLSSKKLKHKRTKQNLQFSIENLDQLRLSSPLFSPNQPKNINKNYESKKSPPKIFSPAKRLLLSPQTIKNFTYMYSPRVSQNNCNIRDAFKNFQSKKQSIQLTKMSLPISSQETKKTLNSKFILQKFNKNSQNQIRSKSPAFLSKNPYQQKSKVVTQVSQSRQPSFLRKLSVQQFSENNGKKSILKQFKVIKKLGVGNFGDYYLGIHKKTKFIVTLKKMKKSNIKTNNLTDRIVRTIKRQYFANHPNIRKIYGIFSQQLYVYLVMEYMDYDLTFYLLEKLKLNQKQATQKLFEIGSAIKYTHQNGFIHRNIQIDSVFIIHNVCKICSFQLATPISQKEQLRQAFLFQGVNSIKRQQFKPINTPFDVWCLGLIAYQMYTGKGVFSNKTQKSKKLYPICAKSLQYPRNLSKGAKDILQKLLQPISKNRISINEFLQSPFIKENKQRNQWNEDDIKAQQEEKEKAEKSLLFLKKKFSIGQF